MCWPVCSFAFNRNADVLNCISTLKSAFLNRPCLVCFCRIHHWIYWVLLSQSTQLVHQQCAAEHWGRHAWMAHRSQRKSSIRLPQWLWAGPHPPSVSEQPADVGGPPLHQESDATTQSLPHAQIRCPWVFKCGDVWAFIFIHKYVARSLWSLDKDSLYLENSTESELLWQSQ